MHNARQLIAYFRNIMPLTDEEAQAIADSVCTATYKKGDILLKEGQVATECYFVLKGCVRQYYMIDGEEKTSNFFTENEWVVPIASFIQKQPASYYLECAEDTILVVGNEQREEEMYSTSRKFETISRMVLEKIIIEQQALQARYVTDTPRTALPAFAGKERRTGAACAVIPTCQLYRCKSRIAQQNKKKNS